MRKKTDFLEKLVAASKDVSHDKEIHLGDPEDNISLKETEFPDEIEKVGITKGIFLKIGGQYSYSNDTRLAGKKHEKIVNEALRRAVLYSIVDTIYGDVREELREIMNIFSLGNTTREGDRAFRKMIELERKMTLE